MTPDREWMIYGAAGYTGELVAREAVRRGLRPVIAGRTASKLMPLANELGLSYRAFEVEQAAAHIGDMSAVLNCAGPFSATASPLVEACLGEKVHYIDITGEIPVFAFCHDLDARARDAGILLCPGAGFDIVPTDCLAASLKERLPEANTINLAFSFGTRPSIGTARTIIEAIGAGGLIRRDHKLTPVGNGYRIRRVPFPGGPRWGVTIPWGDVYTAGVSTGVPNGMVYTALPLALGLFMRVSSPLRGLLATRWAQRRLDRIADRLFSGGPDTEARARQRTEFWGEAVDPSGRRATATISAPNVYALTADTALAITAHCLSQTGQSGYFTPSMLLGAGFVASRPGVEFAFL
ncbi:saccharopine dehydrogenase NADP-binding domain-containing protein [Paracoccus denitrificans]|uniref:saccharopine dehydrogenase family protein n=1 Tax=Paracoccus denitrificans TaxID=266 RepID=UPI001E5F97FD|nr:saccharopine dehydrogenase NADP-binding domain-containing protein [Paracoccus denitrificans]UFS63854.1 saccharopine dehydrogenase NADP-binding domain-containing protein [Paracoccus denitrificans]